MGGNITHQAVGEEELFKVCNNGSVYNTNIYHWDTDLGTNGESHCVQFREYVNHTATNLKSQSPEKCEDVP